MLMSSHSYVQVNKKQHCNQKWDSFRLSMIQINFCGQKRLHEVTQEYYIRNCSKIAVIFTGLGFYSIAKMQRYFK